ncbi:MAG: cysteine--tRNA ligase, partial [Tannerella sp.]|nr:cysteine--tRNA ligase [Tannerella sp.]
RELDGQQEKRNPLDFALWKKAQPEHIMRWPSPWSDGFPGWHCECTAMGKKYLGAHFDIHGGGMDLIFPHHECEIAQAVASQGSDMVRCWMHNNMITVNGQKMGKSLGNAITLEQFFTGRHPLLSKAYAPMTYRFFLLQAHYRSTVDFGNEALQASEKGLERLLDAYARLRKLTPAQTSSVDVKGLRARCHAAMCDDLNTPVVISHLFDAAKLVNTVADGRETLSSDDLEELKSVFQLFLEDILALPCTAAADANSEAFHRAVDLLLDVRLRAKQNKDWTTSDRIRNELTSYGFTVKDTKDGFEWTL